MRDNKDAKMLAVFPNQSDVIFGEESDAVAIIQIILNALKIKYDGYDFIPVSFKFDEMTEKAVRHYQEVNRMEVNGAVNLPTWNSLAEEYELLRYEE